MCALVVALVEEREGDRRRQDNLLPFFSWGALLTNKAPSLAGRSAAGGTGAAHVALVGRHEPLRATVSNCEPL